MGGHGVIRDGTVYPYVKYPYRAGTGEDPDSEQRVRADTV